MNSRAKGARGERLWRDELRANGYDARRGQQFSGSAESPDVVCGALPWVHFEVKAVERLNIENAMDQARSDCGGKVPIVAHKRNHRRWLVTMDAETFFRLLRGEFDTSPGATREPVRRTSSGLRPPSPQSGEGNLPDRGGEGAREARSTISAAVSAAADANNNKPNSHTHNEDQE